MPMRSRRARSRTCGLALLAALALPGPMPAQAGDGGAPAPDGVVMLDQLPAPVAAATWCADGGPGYFTRRRFAGHVIFTAECPGNNANFIQSLVAADDEDGLNARLLVFPTPFAPNPEAPYDSLSNIRWLGHHEVSELFVDPEVVGGPCRHEARWRLVGPLPTPELIFWRETNDCDGNGGWTVLVGG